MSELSLLIRSELFPSWILYALLFSTMLLAVLKFRYELVFSNLRIVFFKPISIIYFSRDEMNFLKKFNWILLGNFFITSGLFMFMLLQYYELENYNLIFLPVGYFGLQLFGLYVTGVLSGDYKKITANVFITNLTSYVIGILFLPLLFIWFLNPGYSSIIIKVLFFIFIFFQLIRILRGVYIAFQNKTPWYYIILYLCAFEIWILIVGYIYLAPNFLSKLI